MTEALFSRLAAPMVADDLTVRPLAEGDEAALALAFAEAELWTWMLVRAPETPAATRAWLDDARARESAREQVPFVLVMPDGTLAGTTRYLDIREYDGGLEIGWTMIFAHARGTYVNGRAKALMLARAFATGFARVQLKTDARNRRSQAAITALGARFEGVLREYQRRADGTLRDTAVFSIVAAEWPDISRKLARRIATRKGSR